MFIDDKDYVTADLSKNVFHSDAGTVSKALLICRADHSICSFFIYKLVHRFLETYGPIVVTEISTHISCLYMHTHNLCVLSSYPRRHTICVPYYLCVKQRSAFYTQFVWHTFCMAFCCATHYLYDTQFVWHSLLTAG